MGSGRSTKRAKSSIPEMRCQSGTGSRPPATSPISLISEVSENLSSFHRHTSTILTDGKA